MHACAWTDKGARPLSGVTAMIDPKTTEAEILSSGAEDWFGLYEIVWGLNSKHPGTSMGDKYQAAEAALRSLLARGWVQLYREVGTGQGPLRHDPIDPSAYDEILSNPTGWYPEYDGIRIVYTATPAGQQAYLAREAHAT